MEREAGISGEMGVRVESMLSGGCLQQYRKAGDERGWVGLIKWGKTDHLRTSRTGLIGLLKISDRDITAKRSVPLKDNMLRVMYCWWRMDIY